MVEGYHQAAHLLLCTTKTAKPAVVSCTVIFRHDGSQDPKSNDDVLASFEDAPNWKSCHSEHRQTSVSYNDLPYAPIQSTLLTYLYIGNKVKRFPTSHTCDLDESPPPPITRHSLEAFFLLFRIFYLLICKFIYIIIKLQLVVKSIGLRCIRNLAHVSSYAFPWQCHRSNTNQYAPFNFINLDIGLIHKRILLKLYACLFIVSFSLFNWKRFCRVLEPGQSLC